MQKTAVITGTRGQDSSYLSEFLLEKGYKVVTIDRRSSCPDYSNVEHLFANSNYFVEQGDVTDFASICRVIQKYKPDEFYNLAAMSFVGASWDESISCFNINLLGTIHCLEAIRLFNPTTKIYQASTSECVGGWLRGMQDENTECRPQSPYGVAKYSAELSIKLYRKSYNLFACYGRLYNHCSVRRGKQFVTRKISSYIGSIYKKGKEIYGDKFVAKEHLPLLLESNAIKKIKLGNIDTYRDFGHSKDYIEAMWIMLQQSSPDDYVIATGVAHSVRDYLKTAFELFDIKDYEKFVETDPSLFRLSEVDYLCGDYTKAKDKLGWTPKTSFNELVNMMVKHDCNIQ